MSVTIKEIAKRTGLSIPTVGNVLGRAAHRYSAETRHRVLAACRELGYRPNASARAMRNGRLGCAALVLSRSRQNVLSHIPAGLLDGLDDELAQHNMHLTVSRLTDEQLSQPDFMPKVLREYMADGMIVNYTHEIPSPMLKLIREHHTPAVWLNAKLAEDCVYPNDLDAAERATRWLIEMGHRRITLLHLISPELFGSQDIESVRSQLHYSVADRAEGYTRAMRAAGLTPAITDHHRFVPDAEHVAACRAMLASDRRPTAVLVYSERDLPTLLFAAAELGLRIPRDLSVVEFYPTPQAIAGVLASVMPIPTERMGRQAVAMLMRKLEAPESTCAAEAIAYDNPRGDTVAPPQS